MAFNLSHVSMDATASIIIHTDKLLQFMSAVNPIVPKRAITAVLKAAHIYCDSGKGFIKVTDCECYAEMVLSSESCVGSINVGVDFHEFLGVLTKAPRGLMLMEFYGNSIKCKVNGIECGTIDTIDGMDLPSMVVTKNEDATPIHISAFELSYVSNYLTPMCISDKEYQGLEGVLFESNDNAHGFTVSNRKTLISTSLRMTPKYRCVLPAKVFKLLTSFTMDFSLYTSDKDYMFTSGSILVYGKPMQGVFPSIHKLEPSSFDHEHRVNVGALRSEVNLLLSSVKPTKDNIYPVMLTFSSDTLGVTTVPANYKFGVSGIKMDALRLSKLLDRFNDNSFVTFKAVDIIDRPTVWEDSNGVSLLCCLR